MSEPPAGERGPSGPAEGGERDSLSEPPAGERDSPSDAPADGSDEEAVPTADPAAPDPADADGNPAGAPEPDGPGADDTGGSGSDDPADAHDRADPPDGGPTSRRGVLAAEGLLALEIAALAAFAFSRPVLDSFGRSPETFVARGADARTIVLFGVVVAAVPALALGLTGLASRALGARGRWAVHLGLVAVIGGLAVWRLGRDVTGWPGDATKLILAGLVGGPALAAIRWRVPSSRTFLQVAGVASVVFLFQFLALSPASSLVLGDGPQVDDEVAASVSAALGRDAPDVVMVVFDALPTMALLDGNGHVDGDLVPNLAALAETSTWYRNNSSVAAFTDDAVPAILTGRYPDPDAGYEPDPENVFTLLGGSYDVHAHEPVTRLCPSELCTVAEAHGISRLLGDAVDLWSTSAAEGSDDGEFDLPGALGADRFSRAERWIAGQDFRPDSRPDLHMLHVVLPHEPWQFLPDGREYRPASDHPTGTFGLGWTESGAGIPVGHQRQMLQLQAADRLLGDLLDRLREAGTFDDALVIVTADHGQAFTPGQPGRALSEGNYPEIAWTPLFVKQPGQDSPEIDDGNVEVVDIVPTVADLLGIEMPWDVDGRPLREAGERDPDVKPFDDAEQNEWRAGGGEPRLEIDARTGFDRVLAADAGEGEGPEAVWQRTRYGRLVGQDVAGLDVRDGGAGPGPGAGTAIAVDHLDRLDAIDLGDPLPIEVVGHTDLPEGSVVAFALNDAVGALTEVEPGIGPSGRMANALLLPEAFVDGGNELTAYLVDGTVRDPVLRPVAVEAG